ncbi:MULTISPECIES: hypothetical protein [unclassified Gluconobacter]|nr:MULTISPECIES: hypothetical protein [unclassified Gluconobacter]
MRLQTDEIRSLFFTDLQDMSGGVVGRMAVLENGFTKFFDFYMIF